MTEPRKEPLLKTFAEMNLNPAIAQAIAELGFETPSPIQAEALPILLGDATDFLGLAATGTGKTAAFGIPLLQKIDTKKRFVQALILCPTRELAIQVSGQINLLGKYLGVRSVPIYGGASYGDQIHGLKSGATVVVGTPGRVADHIDKGTLKLDQIETVVLDEADEMVSMGFKDELEKILNQTPRDTSNIWFFSATMGADVRRVANTYLRAPQEIKINKTEMLSSTVEQLYFFTQESSKPDVICKLIDGADDMYGLIFCQTKALVVDLTQYLSQRGYKVDCLHGDMDQAARERTMRSFRDRRVTLLICTDVASRGLDVKDVTHVINYSLPREFDNYVHRIGRTARSGKTGIAMNLVTPSHRGLIPQIERVTKSRMKEGHIPTRRELAAKKVSNVLAKFTEEKYASRAIEIMSDEWKQAVAAMPQEEVAGRFLAMMFSDIFSDDASNRMPGPAIRNDASERPPAGRERPRFDRPRDRDSAPRGPRPEGRRFEGPRPRTEEGPRVETGAPRFERKERREGDAPAPRHWKDTKRYQERRPEGAPPRADRPERGGDRPPRRFDRPDRGAPRAERPDRAGIVISAAAPMPRPPLKGKRFIPGRKPSFPAKKTTGAPRARD